MRKYKSGTSWCVWRWSEVDSQYIRRLHLLKTPWFAICLHWILKPDPEPWLHDHPVSFLSIVLRGKYAELRKKAYCSPEIQLHRWYNFVRASIADTHRIIFTRKNTLTLCFMGPKTREWGFHTDDGWVDWKTYYKRQRERQEAAINHLMGMIAERQLAGGDDNWYLDYLRERHLRVLEERRSNAKHDRQDVLVDFEVDP